MASKKVLLSLNPNIYEMLKHKADANFMSIQEIISDILRRSMLASLPKKKGKKDIDEPYLNYFSRRKR